MQWFRWYHGTCADPKLGSIARKVGATRERVIAVWAMLLESASDADSRGTVCIDADGIADCLNCETASVSAILEEMGCRGMIASGQVAAWGKRQPSRDDAADRMRASRARANERVTVTRGARNSVAAVTPPEVDTEAERRGEEKALSDASHPARGAEVEENPNEAAAHLHALRSEAAALIREHLWLGRSPPADAGQGWDMGRELTIWDHFAKRHPPEDVNAVIPLTREALHQPQHRPLTMKIFNVKGRGDRMEECLGQLRKRNAKERARTDGSVLNILDAARRKDAA